MLHFLNKSVRSECINKLSSRSRNAYLSSRWSQTAVALKSVDDVPKLVMNPPELVRATTDTINFFDDLYQTAKKHDADSPVLRMETFGVESVVLFSHEMVKEWQRYELSGQTQRIFYPHMSRLFGRFSSELYGRTHLDWRKKASNAFKAEVMDTYTAFIQDAAQNIMLQNIANVTAETNEAVYFCDLAKRFAYEIGIKFVLGPLLTDEERAQYFDVWQRYSNGLNTAGTPDHEAKDPDSTYSKALRAKDELNEILQPKFSHAQQLVENGKWEKEFGTGQECLLKAMLENDAFSVLQQTGAFELSDSIDMIVSLAFGAYDTSATSLNNLVYAVWKYPAEADKVRKAILNDPALSDSNTVFTLEMLKNCNELECFIQESQRLFGIVPWFNRTVRDPNGLNFGGYALKQGMHVTVPVKWLHTGDGSWTDALEFRPSRFDKTQSKEERGDIGRYNNIPFATGLHKCLGIHLAMLEMRIYLALLLRDWEFELDASKLVEESAGVVNGVNLTQSIPHFNVHLKLDKRAT